MGQRLNLELTDGEIVLCGCCFHEAAYSEEALDITEYVTKTYDEIFGGSGTDLFVAVKLLEAIGAGINGIERNRIVKDRSGKYENIDFAPFKTIYDGVIFVTVNGIKENRRWEDARVCINLKTRTVGFHAHYYTYLEEYIEFAERIPDAMLWEDLPRVDVQPDIFSNVDFEHLPVIRRIMNQYPNGFRISCGDVIEWM